MDIKFRKFSDLTYGGLKKENKMLYDFFYKRFLDKRLHKKYSSRNIYGFELVEHDFDSRAVNGSLMIEAISPEGETFWERFYYNKMTEAEKTRLINLVKKELSITPTYNLWI